MRAPQDQRWEGGRLWLMRSYTGGPVLDVGCGRRPFVKHAVTVDLYAGPDRLYPAEVVSPSFQCDYHHLTMFTDNAFAFVVSIDSIEHSPTPIIALKEWFRVLAPEGKIGLLVPDSRWTPPQPEHPHEWTAKTFKEEVLDLFLGETFEAELVRDGIVMNWWAGFVIRKCA